MKKRVTWRWRSREAQSCKQVVLCVCDCQWGAVINKLCDSSYRRHLLWRTHGRTHTHTCCSDDHSFPWGYESPGRTCVRLQHPSCFPLLSLSTFFSSSPYTDLCSVRSLSHLPFHIHSSSLVNPFLTHLLTSPLCISSPPPRATLFTVADIFRVWRAVKSLWRSMCAAWLLVLSHSMMERLAYLWHGSSCFCHMFDVLRALGIRPIFHWWAGCCRNLAAVVVTSRTWLSVEPSNRTHSENIEENIRWDT